MKRVYESFEEMADDMTDGEFIAHQLSEHSTGVCYVWATAIKEFARALDRAGIKLPDDPKIYEDFWQNMMGALVEWKAGYGKPKKYSKLIGKIKVDEARQKFGKDVAVVGMRIMVPSYWDGEFRDDYYLVVPD